MAVPINHKKQQVIPCERLGEFEGSAIEFLIIGERTFLCAYCKVKQENQLTIAGICHNYDGMDRRRKPGFWGRMGRWGGRCGFIPRLRIVDC